MNNKRTFRIVLHVTQGDMVKIVQAARALKALRSSGAVAAKYLGG